MLRISNQLSSVKTLPAFTLPAWIWQLPVMTLSHAAENLIIHIAASCRLMNSAKSSTLICGNVPDDWHESVGSQPSLSCLAVVVWWFIGTNSCTGFWLCRRCKNVVKMFYFILFWHTQEQADGTAMLQRQSKSLIPAPDHFSCFIIQEYSVDCRKKYLWILCYWRKSQPTLPALPVINI